MTTAASRLSPYARPGTSHLPARGAASISRAGTHVSLGTAGIIVLPLLLAGCASPGFFSGITPGKRQATDDQFLTGKTDPGRAAQNQPGTGTANDAQGGLFGHRNPSTDPGIEGILAHAEQSEKAGQPGDAAATYQEVLRRQPGHVIANHRLAIIEDKQERFQDAERHYLAALKASPNNPDVLSDLGYSYLLQGNEELSERALTDALRYNRNHRKALFNLGALYARRGNADRALAIFRQAATEAEAQSALAQFLPQRGPADADGNALASAPRNPFAADPSANPPYGGERPQADLANSTAGPGPRPEMNEATRKIAEQMQRESAARQAGQNNGQNGRAALTQRTSAPPPANQPPGNQWPATSGDVPYPIVQETPPATREQVAMEYLKKGGVQAGDINHVFSNMDSQTQGELAQANQPRHVAEPRNWRPDPTRVASSPDALLRVETPAGADRAPAYPAGQNHGTLSFGNERQAWGAQAAASPDTGNSTTAAQASRDRAAWENAQIAAAQMGLNAGSGLGQMLGNGETSAAGNGQFPANAPASVPQWPNRQPMPPPGTVQQWTTPPMIAGEQPPLQPVTGQSERGTSMPPGSVFTAAGQPADLPAWPGRPPAQSPNNAAAIPAGPPGGYPPPPAAEFNSTPQPSLGVVENPQQQLERLMQFERQRQQQQQQSQIQQQRGNLDRRALIDHIDAQPPAMGLPQR